MLLLQACEERLAGGMRLGVVILEIEGQSSPHTLSILLVLGQLCLCSVLSTHAPDIMLGGKKSIYHQLLQVILVKFAFTVQRCSML